MRTLLELTEYVPLRLPPDKLPTAVAHYLWQTYDVHGHSLEVIFPSPKTDHHWQLTALGWIGHVPLDDAHTLVIHPKIPWSALFRMWEVAYGLESHHLLAGLVDVASVRDFYQHLAYALAQWALARARLGLYRAYLTETRPLTAVRGRITTYPTPPQVALTCEYHQSTTDVPDNQILAYTLAQIARRQLDDERVQTAVRRAAHLFQSATTYQTFTPADCTGRSYNRLNQDYEPLHALCRFFLEQSGPVHAAGDHHQPAFLINTARLYERFVAVWLAAHLPLPWRIQAQETVYIGAHNDLQLMIDGVIYDGNGRARLVLDTKYKTPDKPAPADVSQVVTYAKAKGCHEAILIYPAELTRPLDITIGDVRVRSLTFAPDGALAVEELWG
jgi:5-methylcytosine-specific restriction enzyme subunit McrC